MPHAFVKKKKLARINKARYGDRRLSPRAARLVDVRTGSGGPLAGGERRREQIFGPKFAAAARRTARSIEPAPLLESIKACFLLPIPMYL